MAKRKRITKAVVKSVSLCKAGKNFMSVVYKAALPDGQEPFVLTAASKASPNFDEDGLIYNIIYRPNSDDADNEFADPAVVKEMAYSHAQHGFELDMEHDGVALSRDRIFTAESSIIQAGDRRFDDIIDVRTGKSFDTKDSWGSVIKVVDPALRALYRAGEWNGVSFGGLVAREEVSEPSQKSQEQAMTPEQLAALQASIAQSIVTGFTTAMKATQPPDAAELATIRQRAEAAGFVVVEKSATPPAPAKPAKPPASFAPANPFSLNQVREARMASMREAAKSDIDWSDPVAIKAYEDALVANGIDEGDQGFGGGRFDTRPQSAFKSIAGYGAPVPSQGSDDQGMFDSMKSLINHNLHGAAPARN